MSKKDFEAIASALRAERAISKAFINKAVRENALIDLQERLANYFKSTNPNFDRERFARACEP
jgi:hypothetical protein